MTTRIADVQSDLSFKVLHSKLQDFTDQAVGFIKTAEINYEDMGKLPTTAFAWPEMRKFAMHNKQHTALSMIYINDEKVPSYVKSNLEKAAALYEIELETRPLSKVASTQETSFVADDYLIPEKGLCKVASANDIKLSIEFLKRNKGSMGVMSLAHANKVLCKKASELKVDLPISVYQEAGLTMCSLEKLGEWLETRAVVAKETKHKEAYTKLASVIDPRSKESIARSTLLKIATTIAIVDVESGMTGKYKKGIASPMCSVFNSEKIAEETIYFAGHNIPLSSFVKVSPDVYAQVLGDDVLEEITTEGQLDEAKLHDILGTLPADLQQAVLPYVLQA